MAARRWDVLVVDDEEDVLIVSKLALKSMKVFGLGINVITAKSKSEAIERLKALPQYGGLGGLKSSLAVAFVDVVMESDTAGLELCQYIREEMRNRLTKLIIRSGQAGKAPETDVVDRYDISAYVSKVDATDDRLYSMVKCAIREHVFAKCGTLYQNMTNELVAAAGSRSHDAILAALRNRAQALSLDGAPSDPHCALLLDGAIVLSVGEYEDPKQTLSLRDQIGAARGIPLNDGADDYVSTPTNLLVRLPREKDLPQLQLLVKTGLEVSDSMITHFVYPFLKSLRTLWKLAAEKRP